MALTPGVKRRKAQLWRGEVVGVVCAEVEEDLVLTGGAQGSVREGEKKKSGERGRLLLRGGQLGCIRASAGLARLRVCGRGKWARPR